MGPKTQKSEIAKRQFYQPDYALQKQGMVLHTDVKSKAIRIKINPFGAL